jgi:putative spermidine/putrescine transport system ATP-binding protein
MNAEGVPRRAAARGLPVHAGASVELRDLRKSFGSTVAVKELSLTVAAGEFFTLLGSSGSGKTTALMMVAGFLVPDRGEIRIGGRSVVNLPPEKRDIGVVFQSYALFPNMTVAQNVAFPLRMRRVDTAKRARKVAEMLDLVNLGPLADRHIAGLSGGEQQRVALARALVFEPPVLLMDEPLGALDRKLREQLQTLIKRIQSRLGVTVLYVTHDQEEALVLSDRIAVMAAGEIRQVGSIAEMYERPQSLFVAQFLGESNVLDGRIASREGDACEIDLAGGAGRIRAPLPADAHAREVKVMVRPESLVLATEAPPRTNAIRGAVATVEYLGASIRYGIDTGAGAVSVRTPRTADRPRLVPGEAIAVTWRSEDAVVFAVRPEPPE